MWKIKGSEGKVRAQCISIESKEAIMNYKSIFKDTKTFIGNYTTRKERKTRERIQFDENQNVFYLHYSTLLMPAVSTHRAFFRYDLETLYLGFPSKGYINSIKEGIVNEAKVVARNGYEVQVVV